MQHVHSPQPAPRRGPCALLLAALLALTACGGGGGGGSGGAGGGSSAGGGAANPAPVSGGGTAPGQIADDGQTRVLYPVGTSAMEQIQYREADGTLVTLMGSRTTERHARERGEAWDAPDVGPGRYFTFPTFYFQNRTFGLEIRDTIPAGGNKVEFFLRVNQGTFRGTTFSLFRNILNPNVRDFGWSLN